MSRTIDAQRRELRHLRRQIDYYCGVVARSMSRERIKKAHLLIRRREQQLQQSRAAATSQGSRDA